MRTLLCATVLAIFLPFAAYAQTNVPNETTVQGLYQICKKTENPNGDWDSKEYCLGYISGVGDFLLGLGLAGNTQMGICGSISYGATVRSFINWAEKHPEKWNADRVVGVGIALHETWPCGKKSN